MKQQNNPEEIEYHNSFAEKLFSNTNPLSKERNDHKNNRRTLKASISSWYWHLLCRIWWARVLDLKDWKGIVSFTSYSSIARNHESIVSWESYRKTHVFGVTVNYPIKPEREPILQDRSSSSSGNALWCMTREKLAIYRWISLLVRKVVQTIISYPFTASV